MEAIRVLCVDDEPRVLQGLALQLRRGFELTPALSGEEGLEVLRVKGPFPVVLSDMRMPGMDGATFLGRVRELAPDTVRLLLTGEVDVRAAIAAVNQGQIFRFLTKPCPPEELRLALEAAAGQHRLLTAERVLLEQTLLGAIKTLTELLSLTSPLAFGQATRVRGVVRQLAARLGLTSWALEAAAMLSQLGSVTLPDEVVRKHQAGEPMLPVEAAMLGRVPAVTESLLAHIPRLEPVRAILELAAARPRRQPLTAESHEREAGILRLAVDLDALESRGLPAPIALDTLRGRGLYDEALLEALADVRGAAAPQQVRELGLRALSEGMVFAEDVRTTTGLLLVTRGFRVTASFLERARNFARDTIKEPLRVIVGLEEGESRRRG